MIVLGLDFEAQGMDPLTTNITEVGAIMLEGINKIVGFESDVWESIEHKRFSYLMYEESYPPQTQEVVEITGITDELLKKAGQPPEQVFINVYDLVKKTDIVVAYNAKYDRTLFEQYCKRFGKEVPVKEWICAMNDVPYPRRFNCKKLSHLAMDHGVRMDGRELHRAVSDVELMLELVLTYYGLEKVLEYAREPWVYIKADILGPWQGQGGDGGIGKAQAQSLGYNWETPRGSDLKFDKTWVKRVKQRQIDEERRLAPFRVSVL